MKVTYEKNILCPFYKSTHISGSCKDTKHLDELKRQARKSIKCEGLYNKSAIILDFSHESACNEHKKNFCASRCWEGCPIALMLNKTKYQEN